MLPTSTTCESRTYSGDVYTQLTNPRAPSPPRVSCSLQATSLYPDTFLVSMQGTHAALLNHYNQLLEQHRGVDAAYRCLEGQAKMAGSSLSSAMNITSDTSLPSAFTLTQSLLDVVKSAKVLFQYLLTSVYAHQVQSNLALVEALETFTEFLQVNYRMSNEGDGVDDGNRDANIAELLSAIDSLRRAPVAVQRVHAKQLSEAAMTHQTSGPTAVHRSSSMPRRRSVSTPRAGASEQVAAPPQQQQPCNAKGNSEINVLQGSGVVPRPSSKASCLLAVSSLYSVAQQTEAFKFVTHVLGASAVVLPPEVMGAGEEALALRLQCRALISPRAHSPTLLNVLDLDMLRQAYHAKRGSLSAAAAAGSGEMRADAIARTRTGEALPSDQDGITAGSSGTLTSSSALADDDEELASLLQMLDVATSASQWTANAAAVHVGWVEPSQSMAPGPAVAQDTPLCEDANNGPMLSQALRAGGGVISREQLRCSQLVPGATQSGVNNTNSSSSVWKRPWHLVGAAERVSMASSRQRRREGTLDGNEELCSQRCDVQGTTAEVAMEPQSDSTATIGDTASILAEPVLCTPAPHTCVAESQMVHYIPAWEGEGQEHHAGEGGGDRAGAASGVAGRDTSVDDVERALLAARAPSEWVFQVSNSVREHKPRLAQCVQELGAIMDTGSNFNPAATHLVVAEGLTERTEKFLSACAAGLLIVPPRYIFESARRGHWVTGQMHEYNMNPRRRLAWGLIAPPFAGWSVVLVSGHRLVAKGISAVLRAGGCPWVQTLICGLPDSNGTSAAATLMTAEKGQEGTATESAACTQAVEENDCFAVYEGITPASRIPQRLLNRCTHILVECSHMSTLPSSGCFQLPVWYPAALAVPELYGRTFTLEVIYYSLCASRDTVFRADGTLIEESRLVPACRVDPFGLEEGEYSEEMQYE